MSFGTGRLRKQAPLARGRAEVLRNFDMIAQSKRILEVSVPIKRGEVS